MRVTRYLTVLWLMFLVGCCKPNIEYVTKYQEVKVPVVYRIDKPNRPVYLPTDTAPVYLLKVLEYTELLEILINEHNKKD